MFFRKVFARDAPLGFEPLEFVFAAGGWSLPSSVKMFVGEGVAGTGAGACLTTTDGADCLKYQKNVVPPAIRMVKKMPTKIAPAEDRFFRGRRKPWYAGT